jgi:predicted phosphodiesterase
MKPQILFCGDPHGKFSHVLDAVRRLEPMAVVLLGDIEARRPLHMELAEIREIVWWIHGNHDSGNSSNWANLFESDLADRCIDGKVVELPDGTRLAGLGGVFRDHWYPPARPIHDSYEDWLESLQPGWNKRESMYATQRLKHRSTIYPSNYYELARQRADILVSHEAGATHPHGFDAIDELAAAMGAEVTFHGHHHDCLDYQSRWATLGFRTYGVGLRGILDREGQVVRTGD